MSGNLASLAKITAPRVDHAVQRRRLFKELDRAWHRPVVWVSGPPGAGKTTLVTTYLAARDATTLWYRVDDGDDDVTTVFYYLSLGVERLTGLCRRPPPVFAPDYVLGLGTFARRYFEEMYARLMPPFVVVFDDFQVRRQGSRLLEVIEAAVATLPEGGTLMILSRDRPPGRWARLRASQGIAHVGWSQLRLTEGETGRVMRLFRHHAVSREEISALHARADGWAAGLVLLLEASNGATTGAERRRPPAAWATVAPKVVFDYFAGEFFDALPETSQDLLLHLAVLPSMTRRLAIALTGLAHTGTLLAELAESHHFIDQHDSKEPIYRFHPLFREFLLGRSEELQPLDVRARLQLKAATLMEELGQLETAVSLYRSAGAWAELASLICAQAPHLLANGRDEKLAGWVSDLPEGFVEAVPWLSYWLGACRLRRDPEEAQKCFEVAFHGFEAEEDREGYFLAWVGMVEAIIHAGSDFGQLDPWIERVVAMAAGCPSFPSSEIEARVTAAMVGALWLRTPDHPDIEAWVTRAYAILSTDDDPRVRTQTGFYVAMLQLSKGDWVAAKRVVQTLLGSAKPPDASPSVRILRAIIESYIGWYTGEPENHPRTITEGLEIAHGSGVHVWAFALMDLRVVQALASGNASASAELLERMGTLVSEGGRRLQQAFYYRNLAWHATLSGDLRIAIRDGTRAVQLSADLGAPFPNAVNCYVLAQALLAAGDIEEAAEHFRRVRQTGERLGSTLLLYMVDLAQAQVAFALGRGAEGEEFLRSGLQLAARHGYTAFSGIHPRSIGDLCVHALEAGIETSAARALVLRCRLVPAKPPVAVDAWPWAIRVYTLGRFAVECGGETIHFTGKTQRRPLELLRALIAFGAKGVAESQLVDAIWPDADGDAAHRAFATTLHRLRKLLGCDDALLLQEGSLSLNPYLCWVDKWAFEALLGGVGRPQWNGEVGKPVAHRVEQGLALFGGPFLPGEQAPWALLPRERLRVRFLQGVTLVGRYWEIAHEWERAVAVYREGMQVDDLAEHLYYQKMRCYQRLGRHGDAMRIYQRCRQALGSVLSVEPSEKTQRLYQQLRSQSIRRAASGRVASSVER